MIARATPRAAQIFLTSWIVWLVLGAVQASIELGLANEGEPAWMVLVMHVIHATAWALITVAISSYAPALGSQRRLVWLAAHLAGILAVAVVDAFVRRSVTELLVGEVRIAFARTALYYADITTLSYILATWLGKVVDAREELILQARSELALRSQLARARLAYLQAQLQPHFLFNALGAVSELVFENPSAAVRTFRQLQAVLQAAASRDSAEIPLREEVSGLIPYLDVQRTRFSDWLEIEVDIDPNSEALRVPPLVFQPLVENSIRHGLRSRSSRGEIRIAARRLGDKLILSVRDNGAGLTPHAGAGRSGVGLANTSERLRTLYGADASLRLYKDDAGGTVAEVSIPVTHDDASMADAKGVVQASRSAGERPGFARSHPVAALVGGGLIAAILWTQQSYAYLVMSGRIGNRTPLDLITGDFFLVALWTAMVPVVAWLSRRFPISEGSWLQSCLAHLAGLSLLAWLHASAVALYQTRKLDGLVSTFTGVAPITLLVYLGVLAYTQREMLQRWLSEKQTASARIEADIADAEVAAATMTVDPESLSFVLSELEQYSVADPLRAEQAIARLGSDLRATLEASAGPQRDFSSGSAGTFRGEDRVERLAMGA